MHGPLHHLKEKAEKPADQRRVLYRLIAYIAPYRRVLSGVLLLVILSSAAQAAGPVLIGFAVDRAIAGGDLPLLGGICALLLVTFIANMFAMRFQIYYMAEIGQRILAHMRREIMQHIHRLSLQYLERKEAGDLMSRVVNDIDTINTFVSQGLAQIIGSTFALAGLLIAMFWLDYRLALAVVAITPLMVFTTQVFSSMARRAFRKTRTTIGDVSAELQEELGGIKVAQAFNRSSENIRRFAERNAANRDANVNANAITSAFMPAMDVLTTIDTAIVAGVGGYLAVNGLASVGLVITFLQYSQHFFRPIQMITQMWTSAQSALAAAERIFELLDIVPDIEDRSGARTLPPVAGEVNFNNVTFGYEKEQPMLCEVNLSIPAGKSLAIVGPTGAGKTTLVSLLMRFYEAHAGVITIDGTDIRDVTQNSLRSQFGMVLQEPFLFSGSIVDNIRYGKLNATEEEVFTAAKTANAHDFIQRLPEGYNTQVGERGSMLSQGQRQLISIARAILAEPRILILDEATASIDTRTEALIQEALARLLSGRTSLIIAHRLSTIRNADIVIVIDDGRIVEKGNHASLIEAGGLYAELYRRQFYRPAESETAAGEES